MYFTLRMYEYRERLVDEVVIDDEDSELYACLSDSLYDYNNLILDKCRGFLGNDLFATVVRVKVTRVSVRLDDDYGEADGDDLSEVQEYHNISPAVIAMYRGGRANFSGHDRTTYTVALLGNEELVMEFYDYITLPGVNLSTPQVAALVQLSLAISERNLVSPNFSGCLGSLRRVTIYSGSLILGLLEGSVLSWITTSQVVQELLGAPVMQENTDGKDLDAKLPLPTSSRTFGLEFEFFPSGKSQSTIYKELLKVIPNRLISTGYMHSDGTVWHLKPDSSCGLELASPALTWKDWPEVEKLLDALKKLGVYATHRCGLHVHHGASDFLDTHLRRLVILWTAFERGITDLVTDTRKNNRYCTPLALPENFENFVDSLHPISNLQGTVEMLGRYRSLNCVNWWRNGTVEVRIHQGTLNTETIKFWVAFTQRLVDVAVGWEDYPALGAIVKMPSNQQLETLKRVLVARSNDQAIRMLPEIIDTVLQYRKEGV